MDAATIAQNPSPAACILLRDDPVMSALPVPAELAEIEALYEKAEGAFWTVNEIDFGRDRQDWEERLTAEDRHFFGMVLAFFSASDIIVNNNLGENFLRELKPFAVRRLLAFQMMIENTHSVTYATIIDILYPDPAEKLRMLDALRTFPEIAAKAEWCDRWTVPERATLGERLVAWACVEGIFFSGSFCALFWLKKRNLMPGTTFSNELIARDEGLHRDTSVALFRLLPAEMRPSPQRVLEIVRGAVERETAFVCAALPVDLVGINARSMAAYIEFVADHLLASLGFARSFAAENPFPWMDLISLEGKTNFFERRVGEYAKAKVPVNEASDAAVFEGEDF